MAARRPVGDSSSQERRNSAAPQLTALALLLGAALATAAAATRPSVATLVAQSDAGALTHILASAAAETLPALVLGGGSSSRGGSGGRGSGGSGESGGSSDSGSNSGTAATGGVPDTSGASGVGGVATLGGRRGLHLSMESDLARSPLVSPLVAKQWEFSLPEHVLQQSFLFPGYTGRLKAVITKLLNGEDVKIGAVGGSVTAAHPEAYDGGYFKFVTDWMVEAFPKARIAARNGGISGTPSSFMERMLTSQLDEGVDLVFIEYALNNKKDSKPESSESISSMERLIRTVMAGTDPKRGSHRFKRFDDALDDHRNALSQA
ncbi:hypothetical protein FOA52_000875 [Chlamydomonas sp. UWO 241]|nr:hypothetical protein FOA52_000875 [Chlamydomonas sp. UWO 241]